MKRLDQLISAIGVTQTPVRCRIAGKGEELEALQKHAARSVPSSELTSSASSAIARS